MTNKEFFTKPEPQTKDELMIVCVQDFDDEYHKDHDMDDELYQQARMIRRRYNDVYEYKYAINVLNLYFARLMVKHGGEERFIRLFRAGLIQDYIPPFPRMKSGKKFKDLLKSGIITSKTSFKRVDWDLFLVMDDELDEHADKSGVEHIVYADRHEEETKEMKEMANKVNFKISATHVKNMTNDSFEAYFLQRRVNQKSETNTDDKLTDVTLTDILDPDYENIVVDADAPTDEFVYSNGSFVKRSDLGMLSTINNLSNAGWDHIKMARRIRGSKNILKIAQGAKKKKKKTKKKNKSVGENLMLDFAGASEDHQSFGDYEQAMLQFTANKLK